MEEEQPHHTLGFWLPWLLKRKSNTQKYQDLDMKKWGNGKDAQIMHKSRFYAYIHSNDQLPALDVCIEFPVLQQCLTITRTITPIQHTATHKNTASATAR